MHRRVGQMGHAAPRHSRMQLASGDDIAALANEATPIWPRVKRIPYFQNPIPSTFASHHHWQQHHHQHHPRHTINIIIIIILARNLGIVVIFSECLRAA